jgi:hypothetical protein
MFSLQPLYLPAITIAVENGVIQNPSAFPKHKFLPQQKVHSSLLCITTCLFLRPVTHEHSSYLQCQIIVSYSTEQLLGKSVMSVVSKAMQQCKHCRQFNADFTGCGGLWPSCSLDMKDCDSNIWWTWNRKSTEKNTHLTDWIVGCYSRNHPGQHSMCYRTSYITVKSWILKDTIFSRYCNTGK